MLFLEDTSLVLIKLTLECLVIMMQFDCFAAGGNGTLHIIDGINIKERYVEILKLGG